MRKTASPLAPQPVAWETESSARDVARLANLYREAHNAMRNIDGLQPQEAFDELLKVLFVRQHSKSAQPVGHQSVSLETSKESPNSGAALRERFLRHIKSAAGSAGDLWKQGAFHLSDRALSAVAEILAPVDFAAMPIDIRSAALRLFLGPELRRGLGIYLTPDDVVRATIAAVAPTKGKVVFDPACGSGTFLIEAIRFWGASEPPTSDAQFSVYGSDVNARMMLIAELNLDEFQGVHFERRVLDALTDEARGWRAPGSVDYVLTNPPFGVYVDPAVATGAGFRTATARANGRLQSEVLFIEQCLNWLRPGGVLGIVLPRSVLTNEGLATAREAIDELAVLQGVINLPPETFAATGTQSSTSVLVLKKRRGKERRERLPVAVVDVSNVGFDGTGRPREGNELPRAGTDLRKAIRTGEAVGAVRIVELPSASTLASFASGAVRRRTPTRYKKLGDFLESAQTGRTPARAAYVDDTGVFTVKVGNLTGQGIDWTPRDRNFVAAGSVSEGLLLREGDILMTSSAHHPRYIAQKVDVVHAIPERLGRRASFVGEVMRLRVHEGACDPFELLAFLRAEGTRAALQERVRGQTAHLRPKDILDLPVPPVIATPEIVAILRREAALAAELTELLAEQRRLLAELHSA